MVTISHTRPANWVPIGTETLRRHKQLGDKKLIMVKVAEPNVWQPKHLLVWKETHGPSPKRYSIKFIDGDSTNVTLENLLCISG